MTGETIPIRLFLGGFDLTPTFRDVNKKFSTRYYLNLVLIDEENRRYFKQQEITVFRIPEVRALTRPSVSSSSPSVRCLMTCVSISIELRRFTLLAMDSLGYDVCASDRTVLLHAYLIRFICTLSVHDLGQNLNGARRRLGTPISEHYATTGRLQYRVRWPRRGPSIVWYKWHSCGSEEWNKGEHSG